jgi:hypothetical protein
MKQFKNNDPTIIDLLIYKCEKYWVGTDALTLLAFPPGKFSTG